MAVNIEVLKASYGDCIFVTIEDENTEYTIMIDGGTSSTYSSKNKKGKNEDGQLKEKLANLKKQCKPIDLLIVTHVDDDHIGGIIKWFEDELPTQDFVKRVWMNDDTEVFSQSSLNNTPAQAASLKKTLEKQGICVENQIVKGKKYEYSWGKISILAPSEHSHNQIAKKIAANLNNRENTNYGKNIKQVVEDGWSVDKVSEENDASIAFILQTNDGETDLFLGDGNIDTIIGGISSIKRTDQKISCKWVKVSHHGSKNNFKPVFLDYVNGENYIFSSNGDYYGHPDKEVVAWLIDKTDATLWFNYKERFLEMLTKQDIADYPGIVNRCREI